ncbi:CD209 antigen-like protein E [Cololabis saira]|uniref:CD209 antigen-like protein E n=1 Tax=Cololabis saira TaxID=129043 RepID=UPI002AD4FC85|nr:CD209 antigen-like protein E [Cololabis saira]
MSTEIQTAPDLRVKFSRRVHKYGRDQDQCKIETLDEGNQHSDPDLQQTENNNQKNLPTVKRNSFRVFKVFLGVFYLLVLVGFIMRSLLVTLEVNQLKTKLNQLNNTYNQLLNNLYDMTLDHDQLQREHDQLINTYNQLKNELDGDCHDGWRRFGSSFYKKFTESKTWSESRRECEKRGADLVIINSKEEQDFVGRLNTNETSWIGLKAERSRSKREYEWKWVDGSPLKTSFWAVEWTPNPHDLRQYPAVCCTNEGKWKYSYYNNNKNWICEKKK